MYFRHSNFLVFCRHCITLFLLLFWNTTLIMPFLYYYVHWSSPPRRINSRFSISCRRTLMAYFLAFIIEFWSPFQHHMWYKSPSTRIHVSILLRNRLHNINLYKHFGIRNPSLLRSRSLANNSKSITLAILPKNKTPEQFKGSLRRVTHDGISATNSLPKSNFGLYGFNTID